MKPPNQKWMWHPKSTSSTPRIYLGLKYKHLTPSSSRDMANVAKTQILPQKSSPLTQNGRYPQNAPVHPRIYLGLKHEHWAPSGSIDMANIPKRVLFAPKLNRGDFFITSILHTQHLYSVKISSSNSKQQPRYRYMNIWGKKTVFLLPNFLGWFFFIKGTLYIHHVRSVKIWRPNSKQQP